MVTCEVLRNNVDYATYASPINGVRYIPGENFNRHFDRPNSKAKPLVIYPPMGNLWIAAEYLIHSLDLYSVSDLKRLGGDTKAVISPPPITERTKSLGVIDAPEMACFPLKATIGSLKESLIAYKKLPDTIQADYYPLFLGHESTGTCRERCYGRVQEARLQDFSMRTFEGDANFDFYVVRDSLRGVYELMIFLMKQTDNWKDGSSLHNVVRGKAMIGLMNKGLACYRMAEDLERKVRYTRSLVTSGDPHNPGTSFNKAGDILEGAKITLADSNISIPQKKFEIAKAKVSLEEMVGPKPKKPKGVIAITGEIFHNEEMATVSGNIGRELLARGYYFEMHSGIGQYIEKFDFTLPNLFRLLARKTVRDLPFYIDVRRLLAARGGLTHDVGGHANHVVEFWKEEEELQAKGGKRYDGIIELMPFGCSPEVLTANIIKPKRVKYLRASFDEQGGVAGIVTRIEAFLGLIEWSSRPKRNRVVET